jgi:hypothetical protein
MGAATLIGGNHLGSNALSRILTPVARLAKFNVPTCNDRHRQAACSAARDQRSEASFSDVGAGSASAADWPYTLNEYGPRTPSAS